ncbi:hypothetical protein [Hymenobacter metallicola]|uniref:Uncharacterized protein n=1 Tax=Hymenobacter metallicola TaxID=2563114 RepID=A0A4Z0PYX9_9BACT|nr:hypothetical protein [Hymenobacter metallicola]TGE22645.1 hypothetical protein E5K02_23215 [Hymenobacter metallicola]
MSSSPDMPVHPLLRVVLERVLRTECLVLESLRLQTQGGYNGLPGGGDEQRLKAAEQRAYQRAETLLTQLLTATAVPSISPEPLPTSSHDLR